MASTRELWLILRARDEASRVLGAFSKSVTAAGLAAQAAQKRAEAASVRQRAQELKLNSATAESIRLANEEARVLNRRASNLTKAAKEQSRYIEVIDEEGKQVRKSVAALRSRGIALKEEAALLGTNIASTLQHRDAMKAQDKLSNEQTKNMNQEIRTMQRAAAVRSAAAAANFAEADKIADMYNRQRSGVDRLIASYQKESAVLRTRAAAIRAQANERKISLDKEVLALQRQANALDQEASSLKKSSMAVRDKDRALQALTQRLNKVREVSTMAAFGFGVLGIAGLVALKGAINTAVQYENQVRKTFTQVDKGRATLEEIHAAGIRVANGIAVPFEQVQEALFDIFGSMEIGMADAERLLGQFSKAAVAGQTDIASASRATIGIMNAFNIPVKNINKILDVQFQLVKEGIGTYEEWNTRIGLVTPSAVRAGQSLETMAAALATATRFSIPAARSATAVSRAMDAMSHPRAVEAMKKLGVNATFANGKFRPLVDVFGDLKAKLDKLPEAKRLAALLEVFKGAGGTIEARRFLQNILLTNDGLKLFEDQMSNMKGATGSFTEAYDKMAETTAMKSIVLNNKWQIVKETIGTALIPAFLSLIGVVGQVLDKFNALPQSTKDTIAKVLLFGSIIATLVGILFGAVTIIAVFAAAIATVGFAMVPVLAGLFAIPIAIALLVAGLAYAAKKSDSFRHFLVLIMLALKQFYGEAKLTAEGIKAAFDEHLRPALNKVADIVQNKIMPTINDFAELVFSQVMPKVKEARRVIIDLAESAFEFLGKAIEKVTPFIEKFVDWIRENQNVVKPLVSVFGQLVKWVLIIGAVLAGLAFAALVGPIIAVVGAVGLLIFAFKKVWDWLKTADEAIRSFFSALWESIKSIGSSIGEFFSSIWETVSAKISEGIEAVKSGISAGLETLRSWWESFWSVFGEPIKAVWGVIVALFDLGGALMTEIIKDWIVPLVGWLSARWSELKSNVKTFWTGVLDVIKGIGAAIGAFITTKVNEIKAIWNAFSGFIKSKASEAWNVIKRTFSEALANIKTFIDNSKFVQAAKTKIDKFIADFKNGIAKIKGFFSGAIGWLVQAGKDIIQGLLNGITSAAGKVESFLRGLTSKIPEWKGPASVDKKLLEPTGGYIISGLVNGLNKSVPMLRSALKFITNDMVRTTEDELEISSPSKKFKKIGQDVIRGLTKGITGTRKQLSDALFRIRRDVMRSLADGGASAKTKQAWQKRLVNTTNQLMKLEAKRAGIQARLKQAEKDLTAAIAERNKLSESIRDRLAEGADITTLHRFQQKSAQGMITGLKQRQAAMKEFVNNLSSLAKRGLDKETIAQLASEGVEAAGGMVKTLTQASDAELKEISRLQKEIRSLAGSAGNKIANDLYAAGIKAGQGLVAGLKSQEKAITKQMEKIANALVKAIKKSLGIRSPSKVFLEIGQNTAIGYQIGFTKSMMDSMSGLRDLMMLDQPGSVNLGFTPSSYFRPSFGGGEGEQPPQVVKNINNTFNITTQEIDPRKQASDLGWALSEKM